MHEYKLIQTLTRLGNENKRLKKELNQALEIIRQLKKLVEYVEKNTGKEPKSAFKIRRMT